ncbi:hypothetical protein C8R46DRAFT_1041255 [Mycena filopes]|nr:hypothetical protein C8R46DRAFT_1041255 [Mycena filopes]
MNEDRLLSSFLEYLCHSTHQKLLAAPHSQSPSRSNMQPAEQSTPKKDLPPRKQPTIQRPPGVLASATGGIHPLFRSALLNSRSKITYQPRQSLGQNSGTAFNTLLKSTLESNGNSADCDTTS